MSGIQTEIIGPKLVRLFYSNIRFLDKFSAKSSQYLKIIYTNGKSEHIPGPCTQYSNPVHHKSIQVNDYIKMLSNKECIIVHTALNRNSSVDNSSTSNDGLSDFKDNIEIGTFKSHVGGRNDTLARSVIFGPNVYMPSIHDCISDDPIISICKNVTNKVDLKYDNYSVYVDLKLSYNIDNVEGYIDEYFDEDCFKGVLNDILCNELIGVIDNCEYGKIHGKLNECKRVTIDDLNNKLKYVTIKSLHIINCKGCEELVKKIDGRVKYDNLTKLKDEEIVNIKREQECEMIKLEGCKNRLLKEQELEKQKFKFEDEQRILSVQTNRNIQSEIQSSNIKYLKSLNDLGIDLNALVLNKEGNEIEDVVERVRKIGGKLSFDL
jgi:hypothetical protein